MMNNEQLPRRDFLRNAVMLAGLYDGYRRAKMVTQVVREGFSCKAAGEQ